VIDTIEPLPGQETRIAGWYAPAPLSPKVRVTRSPTAVAVFPSWAPMNNANLSDGQNDIAAAAIAYKLQSARERGVDVWALRPPTATCDFDAPDDAHEVANLERDTTTTCTGQALYASLGLEAVGRNEEWISR
jgi:hypothetical protein